MHFTILRTHYTTLYTDATINTSYTLNAACNIVKKWGANKIIVISVIAAMDGLNKLLEQHPDIAFYLGKHIE